MERYLEFILNHYILSLAMAVVTFLLIQEFADTVFKKFKYISPTLAVLKMNQENVVILDVRESTEFIQGHIEHALNVPLSKLKEEAGALQTYKNNTVLIACQTGTRAAAAGKILTKMGIENVMILTGGMNAWRDECKLPIKITSKNKIEQ